MQKIVVALTGSLLGLFAFASLFGCSPSESSSKFDSRRHLLIGIDISGSNKLIEDQKIANKAAEKIKESVSVFNLGDAVYIRTFGSYGMSNNLRSDYKVDRKEPPKKIAENLERFVKNLPQVVAEGRWPAGGTTHLVAFLEDESELLDCQNPNTEIWLFSDGIEASPGVSPRALELGNIQLPKARTRSLRGCTVTIFGIGQTHDKPPSRDKTRNLIDAWETWSNDAGVEFKGYPSY